MKTDILGVPVDALTFGESLQTLLFFLDGNTHRLCVTPNPEMILAARKDAGLMAALRAADLVAPDGIGVVAASRLSRVKIPQRVAGCDLVQALFAAAKERPFTAYLLGGKPGVCQAAKRNAEAAYPGLTVVGAQDGYFDAEKEILILKEIRRLEPDVLLVGLGFPKQEKWLLEHRDALPVKLSMAVGGTLDVLAGTVKRAPESFRRLGLEWLYRLLKQPSRFGRMLRLPLFIIYVAADAVKRLGIKSEV